MDLRFDEGTVIMDIQLVDNGLKPEDFINLRSKVWPVDTPLEQAYKALENGIFSVVVVCNGKVVGMGRLVGDGVMYWYIQDVVVLPEYQGMGLGKAIVERLMKYAEENSIPDTSITIGLMAAKGKEGFYKKLGFIMRPDDRYGAGMMKKSVISGITKELSNIDT